MYNHLKTGIHEAQSELNTLSAIAESFFPPIASLGTSRQRRSTAEEEPNTTTHWRCCSARRWYRIHPRRTDQRCRMQRPLHF